MNKNVISPGGKILKKNGIVINPLYYFIEDNSGNVSKKIQKKPENKIKTKNLDVNIIDNFTIFTSPFHDWFALKYKIEKSKFKCFEYFGEEFVSYKIVNSFLQYCAEQSISNCVLYIKRTSSRIHGKFCLILSKISLEKNYKVRVEYKNKEYKIRSYEDFALDGFLNGDKDFKILIDFK